MGHRGPWAEIQQAKRDGKAPQAGDEMLAKFGGVCRCGGTVGPGDLIRYDRTAKKIISCLACGAKMSGAMALRLRGTSNDTTANDLRRMRARNFVLAEISVARWTTKAASETDDAKRAKYVTMLETRRADLVEATAALSGVRGDSAHSKPNARDIELIRERVLREQEARAKEEAEERDVG